MVRLGVIICAFSFCAYFFSPSTTDAQSVRNWTGLALPGNAWTNSSNWDTGRPLTSDTAKFSSAGSGNTSISLGATTQPIRSILFDTANAASYSLGVLSSGDSFDIAGGGAITMNSTVTKSEIINADITAEGSLTISNSAANRTLALNGNVMGANAVISYGGQPSRIIQINGANTYGGDTTLTGVTLQFNHDFNLGGSAGPFSSGKIITNGATPSTLQPIGGDRTLANTISLMSALTISDATGDTSGLTLTGAVAVGNANVTIKNSLASSGSGLTFGSASNPGIFALPPVSGRTLTISGFSQTTFNDTIQDAPNITTNITVSSTGLTTFNGKQNTNGTFTFSGNGATIVINGLRTGSGDTIVGTETAGSGGSTVQIGVDSNALPGPSFTSGPFGTGQLNLFSNDPPAVFQPIGSNRIVSNSIDAFGIGFTASNVPGTNYNLTLAGPIILPFQAPFITNLMAGTLNLGSASAPSTISIGNDPSFTTSVAFDTSQGGLTVINDVVQDGTGRGGSLTIQGGTTVLTNANTYSGGTSVWSGTLLVNNTSGSGTGSGDVSYEYGGGGVFILGGTGTIGGNVQGGTISPGDGVGTLTVAGYVRMYSGDSWSIEVSGASADKLVVGGNLELNAPNALNVTGVGSGSSWVIATYGGALTGSFDYITPGYSVDYGTRSHSQITLHYLAGDWNSDGKVDAADYILWRKNPAIAGGDPAGYLAWRQHYGASAGSGTSSSGFAVPEPGTAMLFVISLTITFSGRINVKRRLRRV